MRKKIKNKKILIIRFCILAVFLIVEDWILSIIIYNANFNRRFEIPEEQRMDIEDFDGLQRTKYKFNSDKNQELTGYMYSSGKNQKGILILAHGFGCGGHNLYMDCINRFAQNGYYVFAYDATGNGESEGKGINGLPQGVIDLDYAITFVEENQENQKFPDLPIALFGHSWGGYSVCQVLAYHPEVKAVIEHAGFNHSSDLLESEGRKQAGIGINLILPFLKLHESVTFGEYASGTATDSMAYTNAEILIVHSKDDDTVPTAYGYDIFYKTYQDNPRFHFILYKDKGHTDFDPDQFVDFLDMYLL
ncbi:MAG: alpha/beta fold hydrolase [Oscillospiraceae bacterium]|nr:alpha/beta fold hydrolase [Oscillospiraceae bacterium]